MGQLHHCQGLQSLVRLINQEILLHKSLLKWPILAVGGKVYFPRRPVLQMDMLPFFNVVD